MQLNFPHGVRVVIGGIDVAVFVCRDAGWAIAFAGQ